jgi:3-hydroxy acid dehydrogenase / malonic semialdehyde reductase
VYSCQAGSNVILCARRTDQLKKIADACTTAHKESGVQAGGKFAAVQLDVADKQQVATLFDRVPSELRQVDVLG